MVNLISFVFGLVYQVKPRMQSVIISISLLSCSVGAFVILYPSVGHSLTTFRNSIDEQFSDDTYHELYWLQSKSDTIYALSKDDEDDLWLDTSDDKEESLGQSIGQGNVVLCLPEIASINECDTLFQAAAAQPTSRGRSRFSVADPSIFDASIVFTAEEVLLRVLDYLDDTIPSIYSWLFDPLQDDWALRQPWNAALEQPTVAPDPFLAETCSNLRELYMQGALEWSEGEPAINIYQGGGYFGAHKDHLALTVLIPLTSSDSFEG